MRRGYNIMGSIWSESVTIPSFKSLKGDSKTDVLIIGGGMAGILCAYMLQQEGIHYMLVEGKSICGQITKNTTAKITSQHGLLYDKLAKSVGTKKAAMYLQANEKAQEMYRRICTGITCDFEEKDAFVYSMHDAPRVIKEMETLRKLGFQAEFMQELPLPFPIEGAIRFKNQAQFHPLKFVRAIVENLNIYENTFVREISQHKAITNKGTITADKIIVTTHFPFMNRHGSYFLKMYQERSYVIALERAMNVDGMYIEEVKNGISLRNYGDYLLIGGGGHRTGKSGGNWSSLREFANRYYPTAKEKFCWATQDCMTLDNIPYIGNYSASTPDFYVATGFNKWGMTSSMVAAMILTDMIKGKENPYSAVFFPSRSMIKPQLIINACEATGNLLTISRRRCPHMGCALKWNAQEHTWDCPCHGSRFEEKGSLIDNPATKDAKVE